MGRKPFTMIERDFFVSPKFRNIPDPLAKLAYIAILQSTRAEMTGYFCQPISDLAFAMNIEEEQVQKYIKQLEEAGLILFDRAVSHIWVENWYRFNPVSNPDIAKSRIRTLRDAPDDSKELYLVAIATCISACCKAYGSWPHAKTQSASSKRDDAKKEIVDLAKYAITRLGSGFDEALNRKLREDRVAPDIIGNDLANQIWHILRQPRRPEERRVS